MGAAGGYKHPLDIRAKAVGRVLAGQSYSEVSADFGVSRSLVYYWVQRSSHPSFSKPKQYDPSEEKLPDRVARFARALWMSEAEAMGDSAPTWEESYTLWGLIARDAALRLRRLMSLWKKGRLHKIHIAYCRYCGLPFRPRDSGKHYCSVTCYRAAEPALRQLQYPYRCKECGRGCRKPGLCSRCAPPKPVIYQCACEICGKTFTGKTKGLTKCSKACLKEWRRRHGIKSRIVTKGRCKVCGRGKQARRSHSDLCSRCAERPIARYPELREIKQLNLKLRKIVEGGTRNGAEIRHPQHRGHPQDTHRGDSPGEGRQVHSRPG